MSDTETVVTKIRSFAEILCGVAFALAMLWADFDSFIDAIGTERPSTIAGWAACGLAYVLLWLLGGVILGGLALLLAKVPPLSWIVRWVARGEDAIDRMLRVGLLAIVFLVLFLVGLRLVFGPA